MSAKLITTAEQRETLHACVYSVSDAAKTLGISASTIRKAARRLGVVKIAGPSVAGFISWSRGGLVPVSLPYYR